MGLMKLEIVDYHSQDHDDYKEGRYATHHKARNRLEV